MDYFNVPKMNQGLYRFGLTWGWVINNIILCVGWTKPLINETSKKYIIFADWKKVAWMLRVNTKHKLMQISVRSKIQV